LIRSHIINGHSRTLGDRARITLAQVVASFQQLFSATARGRKLPLDTAFAISWPIENSYGKIVARDAG
jgi:hypothetical protein